MKILYTLSSLLLLLIAANSFAASPTIPASAVKITLVDGNSFRVQWTNGNGQKRLVAIRQTDAVTGLPANGTDYNSNPKFGLGDVLNAGEYIVFDGSSSYFDVLNLTPNTLYQLAIFEYNGSNFSTEYLTSAYATAQVNTLGAPGTQASAASFSNLNGNSVTVNWTNGNGNGRLVVMREAGPVNGNPADLITYPPSSRFGGTAQTTPGNYVVGSLTGTGSKVDVTNLKPNTTYHVAVFEYNGSSGLVYQTSNPATASFTTLARPTIAASNTNFNTPEGNYLRINFTVGNGSRRLIVMKAGSVPDALPVDGIDYTGNSNISLAPELAPGQKIIYNGNLGYAEANNLQPGVTYYFRIYESSGDGLQTGYLTASYASGFKATSSAPDLAATAISFNNPVSTTINISWTKGNGASRMLVMSAGSPVSFTPQDLKAYSYNNVFGSGVAVAAGQYCVYSGIGTNTNISNLVPGTTYHIALFEFNGNSGPVYLVPGTAASFVMADRPTTPSSAITANSIEGNGFNLQWTKGNGTNRIVILRKSIAVDAVPQDGASYTANNNFSLANEIAAGQKLVYNGNSSNVAVTGLEPNTEYHVRIYEYSGTGANSKYLVGEFATGFKSTALTPTQGASGIGFSNINSTSFTMQLTKGNGNARLIVVRQNAAVDAGPANLASYATNLNVGSGAKLGADNYAVYSGSSTTVTITNCQPGASYHIAVFEYNGTYYPVYNIADVARASVTTNIRPSVAASSMSFSAIEANGMRVSWTNGNGPLRMLVAREDSPVDALPADNIQYTGKADFTQAPQLAPGQKIMYTGTGSNVSLSGLQTGKTYYFKVFEYATTGVVTQYLTQTYAEGNKATAMAPTVQASNIQFTNVSGNSFTVSFTKGNGDNRLVVLRKKKPVESLPELYKAYSAISSFGSGTKFTDSSFAVYFGNQATANISNLQPGVTYYASVFEANGNAAPAYLVSGLQNAVTTTIGAPQDSATSPEILDRSSSSFRLRWENGSGQKRVIFVKEGSPVDILPVDNIAYNANSFFTSGQQVGNGNYAVYNGTGKEVIITNLVAGKTYWFAIFEYNQFGANIMYLTTDKTTGKSTDITLPVTLVSFTGVWKDAAVLLNWKTSNEINLSHFEIEKSSNGNSFTKLDLVHASGNGNSATTYSWKDIQPIAGKGFYRLKMVDKDGSASYSAVITVNNPHDQLLPTAMFTSGRLLLQWNNFQQPVSLMLTDLQGKLLLKNIVLPGTSWINTSQLPKGMYLVQLQAADERVVYKILN